ncbi:MAG TPA: nicotinate-nucleotide adenylyltransferase [Solirubrobacteraceae bacterium]|nr:nicotinate-nucleotide adenylyltransferase [Solirubrobacteraceae bacterium]
MDGRRIGILGGTFNPPHRGHLALARSARAELDLEQVLLMPANVAPNKRSEAADPGPAHRLAMCRLAVASDAPGIEASSLEVERGGVSYTIDTLRAIHEHEGDVELTLIVGADTARTLAGWREPAQLLELAELAVAQRDGVGSEDVREALLGLHPSPRVRLLRMQEIAVSSSEVRERVGQGLPVGELVGEAVAAYIGEHGLYASAPPARKAAHAGEGAR